MNAPIYYVGGSKGGVGKSTPAFALIDYLTARDKSVLLLETDNANPDVYKDAAHEKAGFVCKAVNIDVAEGWIELVTLCGENPGHAAVVNAAA
jgi:MinD superfamily P-loop ATPase